MIDFVQESGRAGRAGEPVDSIVLVEGRCQSGAVEGRCQSGAVGGAEGAAAGGSVEEADAEAMIAFVRTRECRRAVLGRYLDGRDTRCADVEGAAACDRCGEGRTEWHDEQRRAGREWALVESTLDELADGCAVCWVLADGCGDGSGDDEPYMHARASCQRHNELAEAALDEFRRGIRYDAAGGYACMKCGVEQRLCGRGEDQEQAKCRWPNVLVPIVRAALKRGQCVRLVQGLGYGGRTRGRAGLAEYGAWLGRRHGRRLWGRVVSNGMAVMVRVVLHLAEGDF
jgi:hypothetical protein